MSSNKSVFMSEHLEDKVAKLSDGLTKVKGMYEGLQEWDISELQEILVNELFLVNEDNFLFCGVCESDKGLTVVALYPSSEEYADINYTAFVADVEVGEKCFMPSVVYDTLDSLLAIKKLPFNPYVQGISNDIEGGWLIVPTVKPKLSLKERMALKRGNK